MITIAMKSTSALDRNTLSSINRTDTQSTLTAQGILPAQNKPSSRQGIVPNRQGTFPASRQTPLPNRQDTSASDKQTAPSNRQGTPVSRHPAPPPAPSPAQRKLPKFVKPVQKGQKVPLESGMPLSGIRACFGWNTQDPRCDVDVSAFLLGADGKVLGDSWFVFYGQTESPDRSCRFQIQASHANDREAISIDFGKLNRDVMKIVFVLTIHDAIAQKLHFGMMKDAYIRILDAGSSELASFQMTDYYPDIISMMIGELYNYKGKWKFNAIGNGVAKDLAGLCALYGVQVTS